MNCKKEIYRGEIYFADLNPVVGSEQGGNRPVLILQNNIGNQHSPTVIVAAISATPKKHMPTHIPICEDGKLPRYSVALLEQIRTIDKRRLSEYVGTIDLYEMEQINKALEISIGLNPEYL